MKTTWDLTLLYKSPKDPKIESDLVKIERLFTNFESKYKNTDFSKNSQKLLNALKDYEKIYDDLSEGGPWWYFALRNDIDSQNKENQAEMTRIGDRLTKAKNKVIFFQLNISQIKEPLQKKILADKAFSGYRYYLKTIFDESKHKLSLKEEQLENLLASSSYSAWVNGVSKHISKQTIKHKAKDIPVSEAVAILSDLKRSEREVLYKKIVDVSKSVSHFAESEINAIFNYKKVMDELRGFKNPYSETVLSYENDEKNIEQLVKLVTDHFHISKKFYKLHRKLLKQNKLKIHDLNVKIGEIKKKFSFDKSVEIVSKVFGDFNPDFSKMLHQFVENGQIDVSPRKGKRGGAYCWGIGLNPTFLLLNHKDNIRSLETLAHEMGHGVHTELAKSNKSFYRLYSISTAEVASTFFEQLVMEEVEKELTDKEKVILLHNKLMGDISTIFKQIACFNFENELHQKVRKEGFVETSGIAELMSKHLKNYIGDAVNITVDDGYIFTRWPHIRNFFYVYSYAYGQIISKAMLSEYRKDTKFSSKIEQFLKLGKSDSPENIFKSIGIDTSKIEFFKKGLLSIEADIDRLEKLTR